MNPDTDRWVRSDDARTHLSDLLQEVQDDAHIFILRYNKPVAVLVPVAWHTEMMALLGSAEADRLRQALQEADEGKVTPWEYDEDGDDDA